MGTAGAGKSLLTSRIGEYYARNGAFAAALNLDPGAEELPYACEIDVRDYVDISTIMKQYELGPNGALVMASDLIASKIGEIRRRVEEVNPDYLLVDTPGQIELFAYRTSGPFIAGNLSQEERMSVFLYDGALISSPVNFVSVSMLAASIRLRLDLPSVSVLTKSDLVGDRLGEIMNWSSDPDSLAEAISREADGETYSLATSMLRGLDFGGMVGGLVPISNTTGDGLDVLGGELSRAINLGEEVED
ncbi:GTPase [Cenarchaeum symbiosum A]|uniref:GTPase n=1 Tax=Cenarchaeum symbiosum (strain A) TaxID=414004 RepID=A0RYT9_CENSY|nr:GTPase [Cenarchaeum symbiosum A]